MEDDRLTLKRRLLRMPVVAVLACALVAVAFLHINVVGIYCDYRWNGEGITWSMIAPYYEDFYGDYFRHGWPVPSAKHKLIVNPRIQPPRFLDKLNLSKWDSFRIDSVKAVIGDVFLAIVLTAATGAAFLRLERRRWSRLQFSIADMFSLIATASMVLGLLCLDSRLSLGREPVVEEMYVRLRDLPRFDRVTVLFAIACAVWLVVSTLIGRLGSKRAKR
jgi:hypothetical protein